MLKNVNTKYTSKLLKQMMKEASSEQSENHWEIIAKRKLW